MKLTLILCTLLSIFCVVRITSGQAVPAAYTDADAYEVYSTLLLPSSAEAKAGKLVIQIETEDYPRFGDDKKFCLSPAPGEESIYTPATEAYRKLNEKPWLLQPKFAESLQYHLVSAVAIRDFFGKNGAGWEGFYKQYPNSGGFQTMSAVGFNADKTVAIVYLGNHCGYLCGFGKYRVLRKTDGKWSEVKWKGYGCSWVS